MRTVPVVAVVVTAAFGIHARAHADCFTPAPLLLWSYPSEGARDVPVDAELWVASNLASVHARPSVRLNEQPIALAAPAPQRPIMSVAGNYVDMQTGQPVDEQAAASLGIDIADIHIAPGPLTPYTDYTLELTWRPPGQHSDSVFEIHFRTGTGTGTGKADAPIVPKVSAHTQHESSAAAPCRELLASQTCFDTVEVMNLHALQLASSNALAWWVSANKPNARLLWPAECGHPRLIVPSGGAEPCFTLQAVSPGGKLGPAVEHCAKPNRRITELPDDHARGLSPRAPTLRNQDAKPVPVTSKAQHLPPQPAESAPPEPRSDNGSCSASAAFNGSCRFSALILIALLTFRAARRR